MTTSIFPMHLSLILNAQKNLYESFCCAAITALGTFMSSIGSLQRRPASIREHLLTYLLELLASIQRHGLKALRRTPNPHYLDRWAEPVQIRVSCCPVSGFDFGPVSGIEPRSTRVSLLSLFLFSYQHLLGFNISHSFFV